ncbi:Beta-glucuronidase [Armadillidium nasatum]|uniref:Beta-glucuronidase n=1 Tax=Armadillidium nasatum TaxID=96803 RepID=A0A5N5SIZ5_9CRUS|nr:Beta-glucuronidase [Armadillidium nasatum]
MTCYMTRNDKKNLKVRYGRTFQIPKHWGGNDIRKVLRLGAAHYNSIVYVNGEEVTRHEGGHLPIMADISDKLYPGEENFLTICINNTLTPDTIPQGKITHHDDLSRYPPDYFAQSLDFDFFNYAGIHRPVYIYTTPETYIEDILVVTNVTGTTGSISYNITANSISGSLEEIFGRGFDYGLTIKDFSLIKWLGANSFRTSHYPYAEELLDIADEEGIMIIDESPAIGLKQVADATRKTNRPPGCMKGLFTRSRQPKMAAHVMKYRYWNLANELYNISLPKPQKSNCPINREENEIFHDKKILI